MKKKIKILALVVIGAVALASCGKMKDGKCVCTATSTIDDYKDVMVNEYPSMAKKACKKMDSSSTDSMGLSVVIKCDYK